MKYVLYGLAPLLLVLGIILSFYYRDPTNTPSPSWIQAGAAASLLVVTVIYARSADEALNEAQKARTLTQESLEEARIARMDQLRPALAIRYRWKDEKSTPSGVVFFNARGTYLVNVGIGPATEIRVWSNFEKVIFVDPKAWNEPTRTLKLWPKQDISFGIPIGPDTGNLDTQVEFMTYDLEKGRYTPIEDLSVVFFIEYRDVFKRLFLTVLAKGQQTVMGPLTEEARNNHFTEYERQVADLS